MKRGLQVVAAASIPVLGLSALLCCVIPRTVRQPLAFDHKLHIEEAGVECADCHVHVLRGARATIPNIELCGECHSEAMTESPAEAQLVTWVEEDHQIPWQKVYRVPDHVYFSHRRHVSLGEIDCETCHGAMRERTEPVERPFQTPTMTMCMACHEQREVSNDCLLCHR